MAYLRFEFHNTASRQRTVHLHPGDSAEVFAGKLYFKLSREVHLVLLPHQRLVADVLGTSHSSWPANSKDAYRRKDPAVEVTYSPSGDVDILECEIREYCIQSRAKFEQRFLVDQGEVLVIKYLPAIRLQDILLNRRLFASATPGFTWGDGVYVSPLGLPYSTMMYGTVGVVGRAPIGTVFDGIDPIGKRLYQRWIRTQFRYYDLLTTTVHSDYSNRILRNRFKTRFDIDTVFFLPDQFALHYVDRHHDCWIALSHWVPGGFGRRVGSGPATVVREVEFVLAVSEEFNARNRFRYDALLGEELRSRGTRPIQVRPGDLHLGPALQAAYLAAVANRAASRPVGPVYISQEVP